MVALFNIFQGNIEQLYPFYYIIYTIYTQKYTPPFRVPYIPSSRKRLIERLMELVPVSIRGPLGQFFCFHYATFLISTQNLCIFLHMYWTVLPKWRGCSSQFYCYKFFTILPRRGGFSLVGGFSNYHLNVIGQGHFVTLPPMGSFVTLKPPLIL